MTNIATYENSSLDRGALNELAQRAAQQTPLTPDPRIVYYDREAKKNVEVLGTHWVLAHRWERHEDQPNDAVIEEGGGDAIYALLSSGELVLVKLFEELRISTTGAWKKETNTHYVDPISDSDIESFDFERKYFDRSYPPARRLRGDWNEDFDRGDLLYDTKGAGLSALLEAVRTGQADLPQGPSQFHTPKTPPPEAPARSRQTAGATQKTPNEKRAQALQYERLSRYARKAAWPSGAMILFGPSVFDTLTAGWVFVWITALLLIASFVLHRAAVAERR